MLLWVLEDNAERWRAMAEVCRRLGIQVVRFQTAWELVASLDTHAPLPEIVSLDHDLNVIPAQSGDGMDAVRALESRPPFAYVIVHSSNLSAAQNMISTLRTAGWPVSQVVARDDLGWIAQWDQNLRQTLQQISPVQMSPSTAYWLRVDSRTEQLLSRPNDLAILVMVGRNDELLLIEADRQVDPDRLCFPGHRDVIQSGCFPGDWIAGFSVCISAGEVVSLNRSSYLNESYDDFALPMAMVNDILPATGWTLTERTKIYPGED